MILKIAIICLLILMAGIVFYANTVNQYPEYLQQNRLFKSVVPRLSLSLFSTDPRFYAWSGIEYKILIDKPVLGYGPENFAVGFDKYYDPSIPYLDKNWGDWWDKAHNIIIQIGTEAGILGIIAYLALFIILFWQLHKIKQADKKAGINTKTALMAHGIQAALISYFVAIFFSFDSFGTYLIFFFLIGYSLHLSNEISGNLSSPAKISIKPWIKTVIMSLLFCVLMFFLWQYNLLPFQINAEMNKAGSLADQKYCSQSFSLMDKLLLNRTFLDSYARMQYVEFTKICNKYYPEDNLAYIKKGLTLINEALKIQPLYTRYWLYMGNYTSILASKEKNIETKNNLLKQADYYFDRALQISPKHQEIVIGQAEMAITAGDYKDAKNYSEKCISLNPGFGECYWHLALSEIFLKDIDDAKKNIETASSKGYDINSKTSLSQLSNAYNYTLDYKSLVSVYEKLIAIDPNVGQDHSTLAFIYKELGQYGKARQEALIVLKLSPESKSNVDEFLKTLP